jgi:hypothetical protein
MNTKTILRKPVFIFLLVVLSFKAKSQIFESNLFFTDFSMYNPAYIGQLERIKINSNYSITKSDFEDPPYSTWQSVSFPMRKINSSLAYHSFYENTYIINDFNNAINYCYTHNFNTHLSFSVGTNLGLNRKYINLTMIDFGNENDPIIEGYNDTYYFFNCDLGFWANIYGLNFGISCNQIYQSKIKDDFVINNDKYWNATLNYNWLITHSFSMENSIYFPDLNEFKEGDTEFMINNTFSLKNAFLFGLTTYFYYSDESSFVLSPIFGVNIRNHFKVLGSFQLYKHGLYSNDFNQIELHLSYQF